MKLNNYKFILLTYPMFLFFTIDILADYFPQSDNWEISTPEDEGVNSEKVNKLMDLSFSDDSTSAVVVIKNGKIIGEKYADGMVNLLMAPLGLWQKAIMQL